MTVTAILTELIKCYLFLASAEWRISQRIGALTVDPILLQASSYIAVVIRTTAIFLVLAVSEYDLADLTLLSLRFNRLLFHAHRSTLGYMI